jgi:hypothetical protein
MAPNDEVVSSCPYASVVLTIIVHPTMMGSLDFVVWVPQSPLGRYHVRSFQATSG